jgi:hypothetical protein
MTISIDDIKPGETVHGEDIDQPTRFAPLLYWMRERESIRIKKERGDPPPWTDDPILAANRFCNVRREDDAVTRWIAMHIRERYAEHPYLWLMLCIGRYINLPETLQELTCTPGAWPDGEHFDPATMATVLDGRSSRREQVFNAAYKIHPGSGSPEFRRLTKNRYVAEVAIGRLWKQRAAITSGWFTPKATLQDIVGRLMRYPGWGPFMAYQAVVDMRFTRLLANAPDIGTWAAAGPGTIRGLNRVHGRATDAGLSQEWAVIEMREIYKVIRATLPEIDIDFSDVPNILCETDKYLRMQSGDGRMKRRYTPR